MGDLKPLVSICCLTYNHAKYITDCLEGFLMQKTSFDFEILIHDDASTDGTREIIESYRKKYPSIILPIYEEENQWSKGRCDSAIFNFPRARGKYIAMCEGDDYWTDPYKLQKQIGFLEANLEYAGCFHETQVIFEDGSLGKIYGSDVGLILTAEDTISISSPFHTSSFVFRKDSLKSGLPDWYYEVVSGDMALFSIVSASGPLRKIPKVMSVYRKHTKGFTNTDRVINNFHQDRIKLIKYLDEFHKYKFHTKAKRVIDYHTDNINSQTPVTSVIDGSKSASKSPDKLSREDSRMPRSNTGQNQFAEKSQLYVSATTTNIGNWVTVEIPEDVKNVTTMISIPERKLLYLLARDYWRGSGAIIDAGCFIGGSTIALANGILVNKKYMPDRKVVHSYDLFIADEHQVENYLRNFGDIKPGDSIRHIFDKNISKVSNVVEVHEGDICNFKWRGGKIEILFIDVAKTWEINDHLVKEFFPNLIVDHSIVIQQDLVHPTCPWLAITMELFSDYFEIVSYVPDNSIVFKLKKEIPSSLFNECIVSKLKTEDKLYLMDRAILRYQKILKNEDLVELECARAILRLWLLGEEAAKQDMRRIEKIYANSPRLRRAIMWVEKFTLSLKTNLVKPSCPTDFINPALSENNMDLYLVRSSIYNTLKGFISRCKGILLDIGCGEMPYKQFVLENSNITQYIGMDIENPKYQKDTKPDIFWDGHKIPLDDNSVDCAIATEVFEHLPNIDQVLKETYRVLKPGGKLFFTVPFLWPIHDNPQDEYRYTPFSLKRYLQNAGFTDINIEAMGGWDASLAQMIGLWVRRSPMSEAERQRFIELIYPFYVELLEREKRSRKLSYNDMENQSVMITGLTGTCSKPSYNYEGKKDSVLAIVCPQVGAISETFIRKHIEHIAPGRTVVLTGAVLDDAWFKGPIKIIPIKLGYYRFDEKLEREVIDFLRANNVTHILCEFGCIGGAIVELNARVLNLPIFVHFHGQDASEFLRNPEIVSYYKWMGSVVKGIITVSEPMTARLIEIGIPGEKMRKIHYGVDVPEILAEPEKEPCRFIAVTRFVAKKGIMYLLNAFAKVYRENPGVTLDIIGDGPMRAEVENFIKKHGLYNAVILYGSKPNEFVLEKLKNANVYVQHSITDPETGNAEGLPNSILEASVAGLPVVATNHEGIPEAVEHGITGFLVNERDIDKMAEYMLMLSEDGALRKKMGLSAREKIIKGGFTTEEMAKKIRDFMGISTSECTSEHGIQGRKTVEISRIAPKRILFVNHSVYPYELSGTPLSTYNHAIGMKERGLEVGVLIPSADIKEGFKKEIYENFNIYKIPALDKFKTFLLTLDKVFLKKYLDSIRKILMAFQPEIIHVNDYVFMPVEIIKAFKEFGCIVVRNVCNVEELCYFDSPVIEAGKKGILCSGPENADKCAKCFEANILDKSYTQITIRERSELSLLYTQKFKYVEEIYKKFVDGVVFTTEEFRNYFCRFVQILPEKTRVVPRGFNFGFTRDSMKETVNNDSTICFGYVGNLIYRKGIDVLLKAFEVIADLEGFKLEIYGGAIQKYLQWVKGLENRYPSKIRYFGPYEYHSLPKIARRIHVAIAPSYFETYNRVVRELLFLGIPVIVTDFFGSSIIKDGINGLRIPNGDHKALAEALKKLINDRELLKKLSKGAIETKIPSSEEEIEGLYEFYLDTLKNIKSLQNNPYLKEKMESIEQLIENQKLDQAKNELELIISEYPNYAPAYNELAGAYYRKGDKEKTAYYLEKAIRLRPDDTLILKNLANLYIEFERIDEAKELYEKVISIDPKDSEAQEILARIGELARGFDGFKPLVSIVIPVLNNLHFTIRCVDSIVKNGSDLPYEIIVVDNGSTDETESYFKGLKISHLHYFRLENNLGFVGGCNFGASRARGEYILFLNNDTEAQPGWLDALVETFRSYPDCGACGAKLVYPDGKLQEAGGIIFSDGTGWNYGRGMDPQDPRFNFVREVDYCSGAALMVRRDLWEQIGGFDERYTPAYYEDTDLCFEIRRRGYKVYYQPKSVIIHYEGKTAGIDLSGGFKKYQVSNREKFIQKWKEDLKKQFNFDVKNVLNASERGIKKRILVLDYFLPMFDKASGSLRLFNILKAMKELDCHVSFIAMNEEGEARYRPILEELGVETYIIRNFAKGNVLNVEVLSAFLKERDFDYVIIEFWNLASQWIPLLRRLSAKIRIIVDSVDIHFVREIREAELNGDKGLMEKALKNKGDEIHTYKMADRVWVVTEDDKEAVERYIPGIPIDIVPNVHEVIDFEKNFDETSDLLFVGNFQHPPNRDAVFYLCKDIFPLIKKELTAVKLFIVGNSPQEDIKALASEDIIITGYVEDLSPYLKKARVSVAPLRYGAGMKGKVGEALSWGLPVVTTSTGAEGMGLKNGENVLIADDAEEFAKKVIALYNDKDLWNRLSKNGKVYIEDNFSPEAIKKGLDDIFIKDKKYEEQTQSLKNIFGSKITKDFSRKDFKDILTSIIIPVKDNWEYTKVCLDTISRYTDIPYEIVIVDNGSEKPAYENLLKWKSKNQKVPVRYLRFKENKGFGGGCNRGAGIALGDYLVFLNNDTLVTPGWLKRLISPLAGDDTIGITGPLSNYINGKQKIKDCPIVFESPEHVNFGRLVAYANDISRKNHNNYMFTEVVMGMCLAIKKEVFDALGGFDERFFPGNFEDSDLSMRMHKMGLKPLICMDTFVYHFGNKTFGTKENGYSLAYEKNLNSFREKWDIHNHLDEESMYHKILIGKPVSEIDIICNATDKVRYLICNFEKKTIVDILNYYIEAKIHENMSLIIVNTAQDINLAERVLQNAYPNGELDEIGDITLFAGETNELIKSIEKDIRLFVFTWRDKIEADFLTSEMFFVI